MPIQERLLYASENGDRWCLARDSDTGQVFVRHSSNLPSGGQVSDMELGEFLVRGGLGPEKQELLRVIGSLVEVDGPDRGLALALQHQRVSDLLCTGSWVHAS